MNNLKPVQDVATELGNHYAKQLERRVAAITALRQVVTILLDAGYPVHCYDEYGEYPQLNLGRRPTTKKGKKEFAARLRELRQLIGCTIQVTRTSPYDGRKKLAEFTVTPKDERLGGLTLSYIDKLPKDAKCKIVYQRERSRGRYVLVCES
jgi:hypothetical protein